MCGPAAIPIALGVASAGLGIGQAVSSYQQAQQNVAYQNAAAEQNYQFQTMQASAARGFEQIKKQQQDLVMQQNRSFADQAYQDEISQLNLRLMQEQQAASQKQTEVAKQGLQARGEVVASGRVGNTIDNLIADYYRQQAAYDYATSQNLAFTGQQIQQQKVASQATRGSRIASQQPYMPQPILDPIAPIKQAEPSSLPYILSGASSVVSAAASGYGQVQTNKLLKAKSLAG